MEKKGWASLTFLIVGASAIVTPTPMASAMPHKPSSGLNTACQNLNIATHLSSHEVLDLSGDYAACKISARLLLKVLEQLWLGLFLALYRHDLDSQLCHTKSRRKPLCATANAIARALARDLCR